MLMLSANVPCNGNGDYYHAQGYVNLVSISQVTMNAGIAMLENVVLLMLRRLPPPSSSECRPPCPASFPVGKRQTKGWARGSSMH